jgi:hypothetical protein
MIVAGMGIQQEASNERRKEVERTALALLGCFPVRNGRINWGAFRQAIADHMVQFHRSHNCITDC